MTTQKIFDNANNISLEIEQRKSHLNLPFKKKQMLKVLFSFLLIAFYIGTNSFIKVPLTEIKQSDWSEWTNDDCFKGIDFRVKRGSYNSYDNKWNWYVQFKNRYNDQVNFNYSISEPGTKTDPDHRQNVGSGSIGETMGAIYSANSCHVRIGYLRFGDNDSGPYASCGQ